MFNMAKKQFTSLNNDLSRFILSLACRNNTLRAFKLLFVHSTDYKKATFEEFVILLLLICPLSYTDYKKLHPQYQKYLSNIYDEKFMSND